MEMRRERVRRCRTLMMVELVDVFFFFVCEEARREEWRYLMASVCVLHIKKKDWFEY